MYIYLICDWGVWVQHLSFAAGAGAALTTLIFFPVAHHTLLIIYSLKLLFTWILYVQPVLIPKFTTIVIVFIYLSWLVDCAGSKRHAVERSVILKEISWLRIFCVKVEWNSFNVWRRMVRIDVKYLREQRQNHKWQAWQPPCDLDPRCRPYFAKLTLWPKLVYISYILMIVFSYVHCLFLYMIW